jgi:hypothetical protein
MELVINTCLRMQRWLTGTGLSLQMGCLNMHLPKRPAADGKEGWLGPLLVM